MATFFMFSYGKWIPLKDDVDLREWGYHRLAEETYRDSDGGWSMTIEFWRDGVRTYSYAFFNGWEGNEDDGMMEWYDYGSYEYIKGDYCKWLKPYPYAPDRDWLLISSMRTWST